MLRIANKLSSLLNSQQIKIFLCTKNPSSFFFFLFTLELCIEAFCLFARLAGWAVVWGFAPKYQSKVSFNQSFSLCLSRLCIDVRFFFSGALIWWWSAEVDLALGWNKQLSHCGLMGKEDTCPQKRETHTQKWSGSILLIWSSCCWLQFSIHMVVAFHRAMSAQSNWPLLV